MKKHLASLLTLGATLCLAPSLFSVVIASDSFLTGGSDYVVGSTTRLGGQGPAATGFSGTWALNGWYNNSTTADATSVSTRLNATGLSFGSFGGGGAVESYRNGTGTGGTFLNYRSFDGVDDQILAGTSVYFSALVSFTSGNEAGVGLRFDARRHFGVGFNSAGQAGIWATNTGGSVADWANTSWINQTVGTYTAGTTYQIIGRMDATASGSSTNAESITLVGVYAVGDLLAEGSLLSTTYDVYFSEDDVGGNFGGQTLKNGSILISKSVTGVVATVDELRYGTSFTDVAAVPEPSTMAFMFGIAALGAVLIRRRLRA
jgi:hypothetical protein